MMWRRCIEFAIVLALMVYLCAPLFESVDQWDNFPHQGKDIALSTTTGVTILLMGIWFILGQRRKIGARPAFPFTFLPSFSTLFDAGSTPQLSNWASFRSPPLALRI